MEIYGDPWKSIETRGLWISLGLHGFRWVHGFPWISMGLYGFPWTPWITMGLHVSMGLRPMHRAVSFWGFTHNTTRSMFL